MNEKEFNGLILAELVKIANDVFTNEIEIAPGTYTAAELAKLKDANGNEINIKYVWGTIRPKANADELFWGDFRRFHTKGNHRIRDGTKEANKPKLQPFQTNYYIYQ